MPAVAAACAMRSPHAAHRSLAALARGDPKPPPPHPHPLHPTPPQPPSTSISDAAALLTEGDETPPRLMTCAHGRGRGRRSTPGGRQAATRCTQSRSMQVRQAGCAALCCACSIRAAGRTTTAGHLLVATSCLTQFIPAMISEYFPLPLSFIACVCVRVRARSHLCACRHA
jgi:hypothetical protein